VLSKQFCHLGAECRELLTASPRWRHYNWFQLSLRNRPVNHRFYVFPVSPMPNRNSFSMVAIDTTTATVVSTQTLGVNLFTAQWDPQSGNIFAITGCCPNQLVSINMTSGTATPIATVGDSTNGFPSASAMDQVKHTFYLIPLRCE
jgi:hypothetical protein